ncbi:uncharacterized protein SPAPADRAFT_65101 [Spathaspora passalidarum NRRL Y-27907]|uniref:Uncharacterized protein n=1 Tax=Spathaspora passalidarum (strain NRRL Y-27907 / 11-Y1) TaxID=619300 RepID=G3AJI9_SPAPN|nr:uncharacterized protein SPAPADRAFT_65101 [Spathaspora passalidarum NRRL Y-27907]EGW33892.1 hypothetical protein SPAPADRAFT_65101 [Spathaspora passalidarum NRRL Y-27907]
MFLDATPSLETIHLKLLIMHSDHYYRFTQPSGFQRSENCTDKIFKSVVLENLYVSTPPFVNGATTVDYDAPYNQSTQSSATTVDESSFGTTKPSKRLRMKTWFRNFTHRNSQPYLPIPNDSTADFGYNVQLEFGDDPSVKIPCGSNTIETDFQANTPNTNTSGSKNFKTTPTTTTFTSIPSKTTSKRAKISNWFKKWFQPQKHNPKDEPDILETTEETKPNFFDTNYYHYCSTYYQHGSTYYDHGIPIRKGVYPNTYTIDLTNLPMVCDVPTSSSTFFEKIFCRHNNDVTECIPSVGNSKVNDFLTQVEPELNALDAKSDHKNVAAELNSSNMSFIHSAKSKRSKPKTEK